MSDDDRSLRAAARPSRATLRRVPLDAKEDGTPRGAEGISLVWPLTQIAWGWTGREIPKTDRASMPIRFVRGPER